MKTVNLLILLLSYCLLIGCQSQEVNSNNELPPPLINENSLSSPITFLFSNDQRIEEETSYYDALLNFKRKHPDYLDSVKIVSTSEKELAAYYNVIVYPTLIVIDDVGILVRVEGYKDTTEITDELEANLIELDVEFEDETS